MTAAEHRALHTNPLFYSLTPELAVATARALLTAPAALDGDYYEFGLFKGYNLWFAERFAAHLLSDRVMHFFGFDSFAGMPPNAVHPHWAEGNYAATRAEVTEHLRRHGAFMERITLLEGWFGDEWFDALREEWDFRPAAVAVIDCDLYESAVPVLRFLGPLLGAGTVLLFDDWKAYDASPAAGEQRAWAEFLRAGPAVRVQHLFDFGTYGRALQIVEV